MFDYMTFDRLVQSPLFIYTQNIDSELDLVIIIIELVFWNNH